MKLSDFLGEATQYDKKEKLEERKPKSWLKSVSAFANGFGGALFFGVSNDETLVGLDDAKNVSEKISEIIKTKMEPIPQVVLKIHEEDNKKFVVLHVLSGEETPYYYMADGNRIAYIRIGNESIPANATDLKRLVLRGSKTSFDSLSSRYASGTLAFASLRSVYRMKTGSELSDSDFLSFGLEDENNMLTNAGVLLADDSPIRQSRVFCTRWYGLDNASGIMDAIDDKEYEGSLISLLQNSAEFVKNNTKKRWKKTGNGRIEMPEYPEQAVHEVIVNALIHRDYTEIGSEVHIDIFDNRMEVYSPGGMFDGSIVQNLDTEKVASKRRNPIIADIFSRMHLMERRGSGFKKIKTAYQNAVNYRPEVEPRFHSDHTSFFVTLYNLNYNIPIEKALTCTSGGMSDCDEKVLIGTSKRTDDARSINTQMNMPDGDKKVLIDASKSTPVARSINTPKNLADDKSMNSFGGSNSGDNDLISTAEDMSDGVKKVLIETSESTADARSINTQLGTSDGDGKVLIDTPDWAAETTPKLIAACLAVADIIHSLNAIPNTRDSIKKLFIHMNFVGVFGRKELMETLNISITAAGNLINKMKEAKLIEPLSGHGKGKYRFRVPHATS